eukprot:CAMPEP_0118685548 /NCGR_PEP_ID=MMETSP0800-20121206/7311_1 /TAXON_ID=210618 ORGANISM="Striatella unipunctata, Strain CCMP2910" /NCGR_SAMPLE_ID=MMETSP0800 /ASSEMBLY_ACC=CAM_ASM_000638 /LENGTH=96 /DNA_ID=CAMNT_0006582479 /DNA_START=42 /DNA_END=332 /DNA_ORIENTATION=-
MASLYERKESAGAPNVVVEESPCLGGCKQAPCVAIEHEEYEGNIGLEGMHDDELTARLFYRIVTDDDVQRVWDAVENGIRVMAEEEDDDDDDDDEY